MSAKYKYNLYKFVCSAQFVKERMTAEAHRTNVIPLQIDKCSIPSDDASAPLMLLLEKCSLHNLLAQVFALVCMCLIFQIRLRWN